MNAKTAICGFDSEHIHVRGKELVDELVGQVNFTEMFLLQALGKRPGPAQSRIVDAVMVTIMEHGLVPSAAVTRLTHHGAPESFQGAVAAGLLGVGDRYAGTAGECGALLQRIVDSGDATAAAVVEVEALRSARSPVPGFGHPIHKQTDRRVRKLLDLTREAGTPGRYLAALDALVAADDSVVNKGLVVNVSAAIAAALGEAGVPHALMRGVVLTARCAGLVGHLL
jgi:citrate synthase